MGAGRLVDDAERRKLRLAALDTVDRIGAAESLQALYMQLEEVFHAFAFDHFIIYGIPMPHERLERAVVYNFVRVHKALRMSPAMAAGVSKTLWSMEDVAALIEADEAPAKKRGPYKKRTA